jgi:hypothetical protein
LICTEAQHERDGGNTRERECATQHELQHEHKKTYASHTAGAQRKAKQRGRRAATVDRRAEEARGRRVEHRLALLHVDRVQLQHAGNALRGAGNATEDEKLAIRRGAVVDDLHLAVVRRAVKHLFGRRVAVHRPVVDGRVRDDGDRVLVEPPPEDNVASHGDLLHVGLHLEVANDELVAGAETNHLGRRVHDGAVDRVIYIRQLGGRLGREIDDLDLARRLVADHDGLLALDGHVAELECVGGHSQLRELQHLGRLDRRARLLSGHLRVWVDIRWKMRVHGQGKRREIRPKQTVQAWIDQLRANRTFVAVGI